MRKVVERTAPTSRECEMMRETHMALQMKVLTARKCEMVHDDVARAAPTMREFEMMREVIERTAPTARECEIRTTVVAHMAGRAHTGTHKIK